MKRTGYREHDGISDIRSIGGKLFYLWATRNTKREAETETKRLRREYNAVNQNPKIRIVKFSKGYAIYHRK